MTRALPLVRLVGFGAIIILCVIAQAQFDAISEIGYAWLAIAGVIAFLLIAPVPEPDWYPKVAAAFDLARGFRRWLGLIVLIVGLAILGHSALMFHQQLLITENFGDAPWIEFVIGLPITLLGAVLIVGIGRLPRPDITMLILIGIVALALFVRVYQLDRQPFGVWYDEASYNLIFRQMQSDPTFRPVTNDAVTFPQLLAWAGGYVATGSVVGMRVAEALQATLGVIFAYLVGRELRGKWFGVLMAIFLAVLHWSIDFSRIALPGAETVTFTLIAFYGALRITHYGRMRDAIWFGIAVGVGGYGYGEYLTQVLALIVFVLLIYPFRRRAFSHTIILGVVSVIAALLVLIPMVMFIVDRPDEYFQRLSEVSIFNENDFAPGVTVNDAILQSTVLHLEMFHLRGDSNGRHNLPNAPMLDPITGALLIIGLFAALRELWSLRLRRREHLLFILSIILALLNGILSVRFEAPQSHRAIAAIVGVIYFASLGLDGMARLVAGWFNAGAAAQRQSARRLVIGFDAAVVLVVIGGWNFNFYFNLERTNSIVWSSYSTAQTLTGRLYAAYSDNTQFYVSPLIGSDDPVSQFLASDALTRSHAFVMPDPFPLRVPANAPVVMMIEPLENIYLDYLHQLYPNAHFRPIRPVDYGVIDDPNNTLLTVIELSPQDLSAIAGLDNGAGIIYAPQYDQYTFTFAIGTQVQIDNVAITSGTPVELAEGSHKIAVTPANTSLTWQYSAIDQPQTVPTENLFHGGATPNGLLATFYANGNFEGAPASKRIYPFAYQYIQILPMNRPYSVRYDGYLYVPVDGEYHFGISARDAGALDIDGKNVIQTPTPDSLTEAVVTLTAGWHPVEVRHQDLTGYTNIYFSWEKPDDTDLIPVNRDYLCPALNLCPTPQTN